MPRHITEPRSSRSSRRVDRVTVLTSTHTGEAIGVVRAAVGADIPVVIAFTVETDGRLPSGQALDEAIAEVDDATNGAPLHFGINCAHPDHFAAALDSDPAAIGRIGLLRANASRSSHSELDEAEDLDEGDPVELARQYADLLVNHPHLQVLGGCCGTDSRHVEAIARACVPPRRDRSAAPSGALPTSIPLKDPLDRGYPAGHYGTARCTEPGA